jgi:tight adherence protein B
MLRLRILGPYTLPGIVLVAAVAAAAWVGRGALQRWLIDDLAGLSALLLATFLAVVVLILALWVEHDALQHAWRRRMSGVLGGKPVAEPSPTGRLLRRLPDPLEWIARPILRSTAGRQLAADWVDAGLGSKVSRPIALLLLTGLAGWVIGSRIAGPLFALALALSLPLLPRAWIRARAEAARRRFGEQLPQVLDALAAGVAAGLSFQQAVSYAADELPAPAAEAMRTLARRMALGFPVEQALTSLLEKYPEDSFELAIDGITLQRQFGGDLVRMLEETGARLRERVELEQEVRAITAQGRLSAIVLAALVPVSAGLLMLSNPRYVDVLFDNWIGQTLLVISLVLLLAGWAVVSRLVRVSY